MEKRLCIDATLLRDDRITGVERYIIELIKGLKKINAGDDIYILLAKNFTQFASWIDYGKPLYSPFSSRILTDQFWIPYVIKKFGIDLIHFPVFGAPVLCRAKFLLTIHDATPWRFPETISKGMKYYYKPLFNQAIKRACHILTVSESSKKDIIKYLNVPDDKISVVYEAVSENFSIINDSIGLPDEIAGQMPYILSVGTLEPRKNVQLLLSAFQILKEEKRIPHKLIFCGRKGWLNHIHIADSVRNDIFFTGFVGDELLPIIYKNAELFVFPSIYEGFGFPLLEAYASGTPAVISNSSSLPEIGLDGCLYADPTSVEDFVDKINLCLSDQPLRLNLKSRSKEILAKYSWNVCAKQTFEAYMKFL